MGRPAGTPKSNGATPKKAEGRLGRRSSDDIAHTLQRVVSLLQHHPEGLRAEQIKEQLLLDKREMPRPIVEGLSSGVLVKAGQKRATVYTLASGGQTAPAKKRAAKKTGKRATKKKSSGKRAGKKKTKARIEPALAPSSSSDLRFDLSELALTLDAPRDRRVT